MKTATRAGALLGAALVSLALSLTAVRAASCVDCHNGISPGIVADWLTPQLEDLALERQ